MNGICLQEALSCWWKLLPKLKEGEKLWEVGGSYMYMKKNGDIIMATLSQGQIYIESNTGTLKEEFVNWKLTTDAGVLYFGMSKRIVPDTQGFAQVQAIQDNLGNTYSEFHLQVVEFIDGSLSMKGVSNPIADITFGTVIDQNGNVIAKDGNVAPTAKKQLAINIKLPNASSTTQILIDKEGRVTINAPFLNINNGSVDEGDSDIAYGLETNNAQLGTKGQHVAREQDEITVPISQSYTDNEHSGLTDISLNNYSILALLAKNIISPAGPCFLIPPNPNTAIKGLITQGSKNMYAGDD